MDKDIQWYIRGLSSEECYCGKPKRMGFALCYRCYKTVSADVQHRLYRKIGAGYREAYEDAIKELEDSGVL